MSAKHRILAGALALGEFTVPELVRFTRAKSGTVYTVLNRYGHYFSRTDDDDTPKKRGGRLKRYRLTLSQAHELRRELGSVLDLPVGPGSQAIDETKNDITYAASAAVRELLESLDGDFGGLEPVRERLVKRGLLALRTVEDLRSAARDMHDGVQPSEIDPLDPFVDIANALAKFVRLYARYKLRDRPTLLHEREEVESAQMDLNRLLLATLSKGDLDPLVRNLAVTIGNSKASAICLHQELLVNVSDDDQALRVHDLEFASPTQQSNNNLFSKMLKVFGLTIVQKQNDSDSVLLISASHPTDPAVGEGSTADLPNESVSDLAAFMDTLPPPNFGALVH